MNTILMRLPCSNEWKICLENKDFFYSLPAIFSKFGIGLIYTPYIDKTVYGAVRWIDNKPLIQISDRNKSLAVCLHTLFHEIGHVLLHEHDDVFDGCIYENKSKHQKKEQEANQYAYEQLYNGDSLRKYIFQIKNIKKNTPSLYDADFIGDTACKFGISPMFVAYWMKRSQILSIHINKHIPKIDFNEVISVT